MRKSLLDAQWNQAGSSDGTSENPKKSEICKNLEKESTVKLINKAINQTNV